MTYEFEFQLELELYYSERKKNICWVICLLAVVKSVNPLSDLILNVFINGYLSSNPEIQNSKLEFQL